jgi:two-component system, chemotaxis family, sensor histidine kinase and response regulator WspE
VLTVPKNQVEYIENRQYFHHEGKNIGLISGAQILGFEEKRHVATDLPVIIINDYVNNYGIVVDAFLEEKELVLHDIDPRLGKVPDILAGAFMEDGSPILILDVEDIVRTIDNILSTGKLSKLSYNVADEQAIAKKRILVIDDSITVREIECRLLRNRGYDVEAAVNGMEGWNALRMAHFDLVVTDVDMPRMNGIELVKAIKADPRLKSIPVMIVSYKEREEDRIKGLEAGANYYLTKSGFHDQALINAVIDLIGEA